MSSGRERKFMLQKTFLLGAIGVMVSGIVLGYANFYQQVSQYTQSVAYRETSEASKEYSPQLMKRNKRLLSRIQPGTSTKCS